MTTSTNDRNTVGKGSFAEINGLKMYYEIHGTGKPLVLLPGGLMTIGMMGQILPSLASTRQVIAVELQAHGHTADIDRPLTYEQMADDVAALIKHLGLERADVFGFSVGAGVALQTAIRHSKLVRKLVVAKMRQLLTEHYDWTQDVAAIQAPTLIVIGDADTVRPAHAVELFELLGGGKAASAMGNLSNAQLAVLTGTTEFSLLAR